jgi:SAM-dependent methyltransferase
MPALEHLTPVDSLVLPSGSAAVPRSQAPLRLEPARCCLCPIDDPDPLGVGEDFEYRTSPDTFLAVRCRGCGTVYLDLRPVASELPRIYPPSYHAFDFSSQRFGLSYRVRRVLEAHRLLGFCRGLGPQARILDVGCGDGFHLRLLRESGPPGWSIEGVDPSDRAVGAATATGLRVHQGRIEDLDLPESSFDLALLMATIEHVDDPIGMLTRVRALLRPGGRLVLTTDNAQSWSFRIFKRRHWGGYHFPRHFYLFSSESLRRLIEHTGFEIERLGTLVTPVNWVYSIRNALVDWKAPTGIVEQFSLSSPLSLGFFTLFGAVQQFLGRGELLYAVIRRPQDGPQVEE